MRTVCAWLRRSSDAGDLGPNLKGLDLGGWNLVTAEQEEVVDPIMGGQEAPRLARRLEVLHLSLSLSGRLVRVLRPVIEAPAGPFSSADVA